MRGCCPPHPSKTQKRFNAMDCRVRPGNDEKCSASPACAMLARTIRAGSTKGPPLPNDPLDELYRRPGFMIRRAHQIAVALFLEETGELKITTTQYGILCILERRP